MLLRLTFESVEKKTVYSSSAFFSDFVAEVLSDCYRAEVKA